MIFKEHSLLKLRLSGEHIIMEIVLKTYTTQICRDSSKTAKARQVQAIFTESKKKKSRI